MFVNDKNIIGVDSGNYESVVYFNHEERWEKILHEPKELHDWFESHSSEDVVFACESTQDVFSQMAMQRGFRVFSTTPLQASHMRKAMFVSGKKDDKNDALVHARALELNPRMFREIELLNDNTEALKLRLNWREQLVASRIASENKLRSILKDVFPGLHQMRINLGAQWVLEMLSEAPTSNLFLKYKNESTLKRLSSLLNVSIEMVVKTLSPFALKETKCFFLKGDYLAEIAKSTLKIVRKIKAHEREIKVLLEEIEADGKEEKRLSSIKILQSFPKMGPLTLARIIAEYPEILTNPDPKNLRAYAGATPVTKQSGGARFVHRRFARNKKLQTALCLLAKNTLRGDRKMKELFARHRAKGKKEFGAYRAMTRNIINTLCAMLRTGTVYKPVL